MLRVGTIAPDFTAQLDDGTTFSLAEQRGMRNVVLYFYPKDFTTGCTAEACGFRDNYDEIGAYDAEIYGVSRDGEERHQAFRKRHTLPFRLIADPERKVIGLYGARGLIPGMTARVTYVIDKEGVIRAAMRHDLLIGRHVTEVIAALKGLEGAPKA